MVVSAWLERERRDNPARVDRYVAELRLMPTSKLVALVAIFETDASWPSLSRPEMWQAPLIKAEIDARIPPRGPV